MYSTVRIHLPELWVCWTTTWVVFYRFIPSILKTDFTKGVQHGANPERVVFFGPFDVSSFGHGRLRWC